MLKKTFTLRSVADVDEAIAVLRDVRKKFAQQESEAERKLRAEAAEFLSGILLKDVPDFKSIDWSKLPQLMDGFSGDVGKAVLEEPLSVNDAISSFERAAGKKPAKKSRPSGGKQASGAPSRDNPGRPAEPEGAAPAPAAVPNAAPGFSAKPIPVASAIR